MDNINKIIQILIIVLTSAFISAMTLIAIVLVPFWQNSEPQVFLDWFTMYSSIIGAMMIPLGPGLLLLTIATYFLSTHAKKLWGLTAIFIMINVLYFPMYYLPANNSFAEQTIELSNIAAELSTWLNYHWQRVFFASLALVTSIMAVLKTK